MAPLLQPKQFKVKRRKALLELLKRENQRQIENKFTKKSEFKIKAVWMKLEHTQVMMMMMTPRYKCACSNQVK